MRKIWENYLKIWKKNEKFFKKKNEKKIRKMRENSYFEGQVKPNDSK